MRSFGKLFAAMSFAMVVTNINSESKNKKGNTHYTCYDVRNKQGTQYEKTRLSENRQTCERASW